MECPKCHFDHPLQTTECLRCGIIFSKYAAYIAAAAATAAAAPAVATPSIASVNLEPASSEEEQHSQCDNANRELVYRACALPGALLLGWLVVKAMPLLADLLRMWTHETGHAITAWLCGHVAIPTPWITIGSAGRVPAASLLLGAALACGGYFAWRLERWFWVAVSVLTLVLLVAGNVRSEFQARCLIVFGGDAGSFVVSTILIATFYARPQSAMCRKHLRWVLLILGAITFMDTYATWAGGFEKIVQWLDGIDERGPTDLAQLTQYFGWSIWDMQTRFLRVAHFCFVAMAAMYAVGILQTMQIKTTVLRVASGSH